MYLLDIGFPHTFTNGTIKSMNRKLKCANAACTVHDWTENKILHKRSFDRPIMKNTILIPAQGQSSPLSDNISDWLRLCNCSV